MAKHNILGKKGEELAAAHLTVKGYTIFEKNWRFEVKTRSTDFFGDPEEAVTDKKQKFLIRAAEEYVIQNEIDDELRFDIISIIIEKEKQIIRHIEDAFYPTLYE